MMHTRDAISEAQGASAAALSRVSVARWRDGVVELAEDCVAEEAPVALVYNGVSHAVMLATPCDLEDLAYGFTLSEGIVTHAREIQHVEARSRDDGAFEVHMGLASERFSALLRRVRNTTGRTGCGLCGVSTIEDALRDPTVDAQIRITTRELHDALAELADRQRINAHTGSVHAAAFVLPEAGLKVVREDVGRHNALDKTIGAALRAGEPLSRGWLLVTSRASYEMVQKAATVGVSFLAAVSAPTALAIRLAQSSGLTLVGFTRERRHVVYANPQQLIDKGPMRSAERSGEHPSS